MTCARGKIGHKARTYDGRATGVHASRLHQQKTRAAAHADARVGAIKYTNKIRKKTSLISIKL
ncbi:hypothetical protein KDH_73870 [Dictyobacter sp. S3.2.2.5]|uniref:Uncharacterized protein n=1 Tax=Dictyobacter halimunensis TaxID=3026934 RepID=A0ABQ6G6X2_9CHLR|nr:hypothetical protein KDH_73870 [Dictyobacter sp. S3.2.2.5]